MPTLKVRPQFSSSVIQPTPSSARFTLENDNMGSGPEAHCNRSFGTSMAGKLSYVTEFDANAMQPSS